MRSRRFGPIVSAVVVAAVGAAVAAGSIRRVSTLSSSVVNQSATTATNRKRPIDLAVRNVTTLHDAVTRKRPPVRTVNDDYANRLKVDLAPGCTPIAGCPSQFVKEAQMSRRSPGPTGKPFVVNAAGDPQIAAGRSFVVLTFYNSIWVYGKSGKLATADADGNALSYPISAEQLFASLLEDVNKNLTLPGFLPCDPKNPHTFGSYCVADIYDTRVIYDDFRDRFWLFSAGRNWRNPGVDFATTKNRAGIRAPAFLAVSRSGDPRGGWYLYTFWDGIDKSDNSDYPSIGISRDFFVQTINAVHAEAEPYHWFTLVNVFDADKLASGGCSIPCSFSYWDITRPGTSTVVASTIQPAVQHDVPPSGWTLMTEVASPNTLWVYGFRKSEGAINPPLHMAAVSVKPWVGAPNPPQPSDSTVPKPRPMSFANVNGSAMKASERNGRVAVTWLDCVDWAKTGTCASSIRLTEVDANAALAGASAPLVDRTFGFHNDFDEAEDQVVAYGNPGVELNGAGDRVVVFNRVGGKAVFPEARFSTWLHNESDIRPSAVLMKGAHPCGPSMSSASDIAPVCNLDVAGIAVDPFDHEAVWLAHSFVNAAGALQTAVGKVFGRALPDFQCWVDQSPLGFRGNSFTAKIVVANTGDAPGTLTKVALSVVGKRLASSTASPLVLGPGDTKVVELPGVAPASGSFDLAVVLSAPAVEQYNAANDACGRHVARRP